MANEDESLISDAARAMIGSESGRVSGVVSKLAFQRWAASVKDRNPLYFDADYAKAHGYRDCPMPPLYLSQVTQGIADLDTLRPDGTGGGGSAAGELPLDKTPRRMAGGQNITFLEPVYDGDELTAVRRVAGIEQKQGRSGAFVLVHNKTTYTRGDGTVVAEVDGTMIARP